VSKRTFREELGALHRDNRVVDVVTSRTFYGYRIIDTGPDYATFARYLPVADEGVRVDELLVPLENIQGLRVYPSEPPTEDPEAVGA
jgi:hypothetical protein